MALRKGFAPLVLLALMSLGVVGCGQDDVVTIHYDQIGACNGDSETNSFAGTNFAYVIFQIHSIDNTDKNPKLFHFDPDQLYLNGAGGGHASSNFNLQHINPFYATGTDVQPHQSVAVNGAVVAVAATTAADGASEASHTPYTLLYNGAPQGVNLLKGDPNRKEWPYIPNCIDIVYGP